MTDRKSSAQYVWIFDNEGSVVGIWATRTLMENPNRPEALRMAVAERANAAESVGKKPEDLGFGTEVYACIVEGKYRQVPNGRTEFSHGTAFGGGAFLMFGGSLAPSEVIDPQTAYEVRQAGGVNGLIQLRPVVKKRSWWKFWSN